MLDKLPPEIIKATIRSLVHRAGGWSEYLGRAILTALEAALKAGAVMGTAMREAYDKALEAVEEIPALAKEHPVLAGVIVTVVALRVLVVLAPYVLEWLGSWAGFGELGRELGGGVASHVRRLGTEGFFVPSCAKPRSSQRRAGELLL